MLVCSIRLYFGQGECILLRPFSGDMEEMTEIITRLTAVSQGTEVGNFKGKCAYIKNRSAVNLR